MGSCTKTGEDMSTFEEEIIAALHRLFAKIATFQQLEIRDILIPEVYRQYEQTLQEAYDAETKVEDALTALGLKLEYQHYRLGCAVDELTPLMILPRSKVDAVMEEFHKRFP
jgi:hypothetical protein